MGPGLTIKSSGRYSWWIGSVLGLGGIQCGAPFAEVEVEVDIELGTEEQSPQPFQAKAGLVLKQPKDKSGQINLKVAFECKVGLKCEASTPTSISKDIQVGGFNSKDINSCLDFNTRTMPAIRGSNIRIL